MSGRITELFNNNVFTDAEMKARLPKKVYNEVKACKLDKGSADIVAQAVRDWAIEKGATHFTHVFEPLTMLTAEKHDSFVSLPDEDGKVMMDFTGKELCESEPDGSSFPSGGIRDTSRARSYTSWDMTSPIYVKEDAIGTILCIPAAFCSYTGEALDAKTPLLRSMDAVSEQGVRLLRLLGNTTSTKVTAGVGPEQEYFLVDRDKYLKRKDLIFTGMTGMIDPQRPEVENAVFEAKNAGIKTIMITGDHKDTARAIAIRLGIIAESDLNGVITGSELDELSDSELQKNIEKYSVYARVAPEHKVRIVKAWQARGKIVAMTGDGVNDAPSIKRADIGVGMGITGTDVTKNVADMVLADDNFATIIGACEEGRRIYDNIRKVIQFLLSANLAEVFSVFIATLIGFTIFQPVQLLWVNLVTDCFPALALGMEDAEGDIMKRKPRNAKDGVFAGHMGLDCVVQGLIITVLVLASFFVGVYFDMGYIHIADMIAGNADEEGVMMAFITLNMVEIFHCFNMRSRRASLFTMKKQNKWLWASAALALVLTVIVTVQPTLAEMFFGPVTLELKGVLAALGLAFLIIPLMEIYKAIMRAVEKE